jgi:hypothetical protein
MRGPQMARQASQQPVFEHELLHDLTQSTRQFVQELDGLLSEQALVGSLDQYSGSVQAAYDRLKATLGQSPDIVIRRFTLGTAAIDAMLVFLNGQVDNNIVDRDTLMITTLDEPSTTSPTALLARLKSHFLAVGHITHASSWSKIIPTVMLGGTALFIDGAPEVVLLDTTKFPARAVTRAQSEPSIKGPQESFNEVLLTQMDQLRRRLPTGTLRFEPFKIGQHTHTTVICAYLSDVTNPAIVEAVKERLGGIHRSSIQTSNEIGEYLADRRFTIFPQIRFSERVDLIARNLDQGKVAILTANDPTAMLLPNTLVDFYQTTQDYAFPFWDASLMRLIRLAGLIAGLYLMPFYIALSSVNPDLLPVKLLLTIDGSRQGMPFPPEVEVIIMWLIIEILREAANRLPQQMGTTIGTVGAVVVGTAIVKAGLVDALMIIIVTLTALGLFTVPALEIASTWRWLFWLFVVAAWLFGIYGIVLLTVVIVVHLSSLDNFGVPYLSPFGPARPSDLADSWIRLPYPLIRMRPTTLRTLAPKAAKVDPVNPEVILHRAQTRFRP